MRNSTMNRTLTLLGVLALAACSSSSSPTPDAGTPPAAPTLGTVITDRMGRAAVNTALTNPFDTVAGSSPNAVKDAYNAVSDPTQWSPMFKANIKSNLAIFDGLDGVCGNQFIADASMSRYDTLASVLVDDQLYLNTASGSCSIYLGVEANAVNAIPNTDCGGRTPLENTIDETYSLLAVGAPSGVTNGILSDADSTPSLSAFPFLGAPN
jgi:hypothetical protein